MRLKSWKLDLRTIEERQEAGRTVAGRSDSDQPVVNSRKWTGAAVVWLILPGNVLRESSDLSQEKIWVNSG